MAITPNQSKKISEANLDDNLLAKILGYGEKNQQEYVNQTNKRLDILQEEKEDKADMVNYWSKKENIPKASLDTNYIAKIDKYMSTPITYDQLEKNLRTRIAFYENSALDAIARCKSLYNSVVALDIFKNATTQDIANIYHQISQLQTINIDANGNLSTGGGGSNIDSSLLSQIQQNVNNNAATIRQLQQEMSGQDIKNITYAQLDPSLQNIITEIKTLENKYHESETNGTAGNATSASLSNVSLNCQGARNGASIIYAVDQNTHKSIFQPAFPFIEGFIAHSAEEQVKAMQLGAGYIFSIFNNTAYLIKNPTNDVIAKSLEALQTTVEANNTYYIVPNAYTDCWLTNYKILKDSLTKECIIAADNEFTTLLPALTSYGTSIDVETTNIWDYLKKQLQTFNEYFKINHTQNTTADTSITDLNTLMVSGVYFCTGGTANIPNDDYYKHYAFVVNVYASTDNTSDMVNLQIVQVAYNGFSMYMRDASKGRWGEWTKFVTTEDDVAKAVASATPAGTITAYAGQSAPDGYLICDGSAVSRTTYATLFSVIGTTYGTGDNSTTFNLPDLQGRAIIGVSPSHAISTTGGEETHTLMEYEMPSHNHSGSTDVCDSHHHGTWGEHGGGAPFGVYQHGLYPGSSGGHDGDNDIFKTSENGLHTHSIILNNTGGGQAHNNMQPYIALNYIIKY